MGERRVLHDTDVPEPAPPCAHTEGSVVFVRQQYVVMQPYTEGSKIAMVLLDDATMLRYGMKPYQCPFCMASFTADEVRAFGVAQVMAS